MNKTSSFVLAAAITAASGTAAAGERVGDFALIDHNGAFQSMAWHDDAAAIAILPQAVGATDTASLAAMQALQATYQEQGIEFFLLNPGLQTDRAAVAADIGSVDMPVLMDDAQLVSEMLGLTRLDEAVLYNPSTFELLYRGPAAGIESAIEQTLAGEKFDLAAPQWARLLITAMRPLTPTCPMLMTSHRSLPKTAPNVTARAESRLSQWTIVWQCRVGRR